MIHYSFKFNQKDHFYIKDNCSEFNFYNSEENINILKNNNWIIVPITIYVDDEPVAFSFGRYHKSHLGLIKILIFGDRFGKTPCVIDKHIKNAQLYNKYLEAIQVIYSGLNLGEIRLYPSNYLCSFDTDIFEKYKKINLLDLYINLSQDEEILWKNLNKGVKAAINFARKHDLVCRIDNNEENLNKFMENLIKYSKKKKFGITEWINSKMLAEYSGRYFDLFCCFKKDRIISVVLLMKYNKEVTWRYSFSTDEGKSFKANTLLQWEIIRYYRNMKYERYFMGGVSLKGTTPVGYGIFKMRFNPVSSQYGYFYKIKNTLIKIIFKIYEYFRSYIFIWKKIYF